jgi:hypothetical protein
MKVRLSNYWRFQFKLENGMKPRRRGLLISAFICVYLRFRIAGTTILAGTSARSIDTILAGFGSFAWGDGERRGFYKHVFIVVWRRMDKLTDEPP